MLEDLIKDAQELYDGVTWFLDMCQPIS